MPDIGPDNRPTTPTTPGSPGSSGSGEAEVWENLAMTIVLGSLNMPRQFAPMNLDRDQSQGSGGGPDDPDAENKLPIKPIRL